LRTVWKTSGWTQGLRILSTRLGRVGGEKVRSTRHKSTIVPDDPTGGGAARSYERSVCSPKLGLRVLAGACGCLRVHSVSRNRRLWRNPQWPQLPGLTGNSGSICMCTARVHLHENVSGERKHRLLCCTIGYDSMGRWATTIPCNCSATGDRRWSPKNSSSVFELKHWAMS
jgi:hypothetical protein